MKETVIRKLTSRKLWMAVALFVSGLIIAFGGEEKVAETVTGCLMQGAAVLSYILAEGWADASHNEVGVVLDGVAVEEMEAE
jgi:hypothetical protein